MSGFRERDTNVDKEISKFLDRFLYQKIDPNFNRFENREEQLKGKDIQFSIGDLRNIIVDEKATTHYINRDIPTFAFELSFILRSGLEVQGWFFDESKETEYYMLIWPFASKEKAWEIVMEDITRLDCVLISRKKLIEYLESIGWNKEEIIKKNRLIRSQNIDGVVDKTDTSPVYFFSTMRLVEKPINIIVKKRILLELSEARFNVIPN